MREQARVQDDAAALARLYDVDLLDDPGDIDLYLALAGRTGGPILELAAGSGRVALPLALAGYDVTAVDIDPAMLERLGRRIALTAAEKPDVQGRVHAVQADLIGLELPDKARFGLAILALNSILLLDSRPSKQPPSKPRAAISPPGGGA